MIRKLLTLLLAFASPTLATDTIADVPQCSSFLARMGPFTTEDGVTLVSPATVQVQVNRTGTATAVYGPATVQGGTSTISVVVPSASTCNVGPGTEARVPFTFSYRWPIADGRAGTKSATFYVTRQPYVAAMPTPAP